MMRFDSIIAETDERFDLNGKAEALFSALLTLITDKSRGGLTGFLDKFNQIGLNEIVSTWGNAGANAQISTGQLESALGTETLRAITDESGVDYNTASAAIVFIIPRIVNALASDGAVPQDNDSIAQTDESASDSGAAHVTTEQTFDRIGTAAAPVLDAGKKNAVDVNTLDVGEQHSTVDRVNANIDNVDAHLDRVGSDYGAKNNSPLAWILPLLLLGLLLVLGYWFCSKTPSVSQQTSILNER